MVIGLPKSAAHLMNISRNEFTMPGSDSGIVTFKNVCKRDAPMSRAASSIEGSIVLSTPLSCK